MELMLFLTLLKFYQTPGVPLFLVLSPENYHVQCNDSVKEGPVMEHPYFIFFYLMCIVLTACMSV